MTKKILVIEPNTKPFAMDMDDSLDAMQSIVGGWIEVTKPPLHDDEAVIVCNEEGKLRGLTPNRKLHHRDGVLYDVIRGTFFIINAPSNSDEFASLTDEQIVKYTELYGERTM